MFSLMYYIVHCMGKNFYKLIFMVQIVTLWTKYMKDNNYFSITIRSLKSRLIVLGHTHIVSYYRC